jgi:glycosyltransferase involved in cell wall biosynthesis
LLEGYDHEFLTNLSAAPPGRSWSAINPGLLTAFRRGRFEAVLVPGYAVVSYWLAWVGARLTRTPILFRGETVLRPPRPWPVEAIKRSVVRTMLAGTCACLTIGSRSHAFYRSHGVPEDRLFFTPYTVDNDFFAREVERWRARRCEVRAELGLPAGLPVVVYVGKLVDRKRTRDLLEAAARLQRPVALLIVGDGPQRETLERLRNELGLPHVVFTGFRNQSELPRLYAAGDLFALPSRHEVSPLVLNEAMCAGLGLVVSDAVPSAVDLVELGANGTVYRCADVADLAAALTRCLDHDGGPEALGRVSREKIAHWSHDDVVQGLLSALRACVRRPGGHNGWTTLDR